MRLEALNMLRCPEQHTGLTAASAALVDELNAGIQEGRVSNRAGRRLDQIIDGGLVRATGDVLYPIIDQIPILLRDEAIDLQQLGPNRPK